jgi:hypothetical protein
MLRRPPLAALALIVLAALAFAACRSSSNSDPTPTFGHNTAPSSIAPTATAPGPPPTPSRAIRTIDLKNTAPVQTVIAESGGQFVPSEVIYADLTDDGEEDAVVPISSGGTLGDIAFVVLGATGGNTRTLVSEYPKDGRGLAVVVFGDKLVVTEAVPGPDDPECCPSQLRKTIYGWNGVALAIDSITTEPNPDAGPKATPGGASAP